MNVRFLETFLWLAKLGNFRITAEKLHTTQASVSNRIATLEQDFGVRLFNRTSLGISLTEEGAKALVYAERIVRLAQQMERDISDSSVVMGTIRIGVIDTIVHSWLPQFLERIHQLYPRILIELTSDTSIQLSEQLLKGKLDITFQSVPVVREDIANINLCSFPMRWIASPLLGLGEEPLDMTDLGRFPIISFARNSVPHNTIVQLFSDLEAESVHINCIASVAAMIRLTMDGFGVSALPPAVITRELATGQLQSLNVAKAFPSLILLASHRVSHPHPIIGSIVSLARQVARDFSVEHGTEIVALPDAQDDLPAAE
jgi:DNA-binding transcriptional LysR family regulator